MAVLHLLNCLYPPLSLSQINRDRILFSRSVTYSIAEPGFLSVKSLYVCPLTSTRGHVTRISEVLRSQIHSSIRREIVYAKAVT